MQLSDKQLAALRQIYTQSEFWTRHGKAQWRFPAVELGVHRSTMVGLLRRGLVDNIYDLRRQHNTYRITAAGLAALGVAEMRLTPEVTP